MAVYYVLINDDLKYLEIEETHVDADFFKELFYNNDDKIAVYGGCSNCGLYDLIYKNY